MSAGWRTTERRRRKTRAPCSSRSSARSRIVSSNLRRSSGETCRSRASHDSGASPINSSNELRANSLTSSWIALGLQPSQATTSAKRSADTDSLRPVFSSVATRNASASFSSSGSSLRNSSRSLQGSKSKARLVRRRSRPFASMVCDHRFKMDAIPFGIVGVEPTRSSWASSATISRGGASRRLKIAATSSPRSRRFNGSRSPSAANPSVMVSRKSSVQSVLLSTQLKYAIGSAGCARLTVSITCSAISVLPTPGKPLMTQTDGPSDHHSCSNHLASA